MLKKNINSYNVTGKLQKNRFKVFTKRDLNTVERSSRSRSNSRESVIDSGINNNNNNTTLNMPSINQNDSGSTIHVRQNSRGNFIMDNQHRSPTTETDSPDAMDLAISLLQNSYQILKRRAYEKIDNVYNNRDLILDYLEDGTVEKLRFSMGRLFEHVASPMGLPPLNCMTPANLLEQTGIYRYDCLVHTNYTIFMKGFDTIEYKLVYEYIRDCLNDMDAIAQCYNEMVNIENQVVINNMHLFRDSVEIYDAFYTLVSVLNTLN